MDAALPTRASTADSGLNLTSIGGEPRIPACMARNSTREAIVGDYSFLVDRNRVRLARNRSLTLDKESP